MATFRGVSAGTIAGAGLAAGGYGAYQYNQGGIGNQAQGIAVGAGSLAMGVGAAKIALGGRGGETARDRALKKAASEAAIGGFRKKLGGGLGFAAVGLGAAAAYQYSNDDFFGGVGLTGAAGLAAYGGVKSFTSGKNAITKSRAIAEAVKSGDKFVSRAMGAKKMARMGMGGVAVGGLTMSAGLQTENPQALVAGAGIMGVGGLVASSQRKRAKGFMQQSDRAIREAERLGRMSRENVARKVAGRSYGRPISKGGKTVYGRTSS